MGDLVQIKTGKLDANAMVEGGKYDFYTSGIKKYKIDVAAFEGPAITIAGNGATVGYMHYADGLFNAYQRTYVLSDLNLNRSFLYQEINKKLQKKIKQEVRAGNIPYIVLEMLTELNINYPSEKEQTAIGNFFKQLDETIALHQRQTEKYQKLKTGFLESIFCTNLPPNNSKKTNAWEQRKLGEIATFSKGQGYSKSDLISSGFPIILYGQLYTNYQTSISDVTTFVNNDEDAIKSIGNEVIVPASGETAEDIARATAIEKQGIIIGGDLNIVRPNKKVRPFFLALTLSNGNPKNSIAKKAQGKSIVHIRNDDLKEIQIIFPNTEEQTAIGNFFKQLDETIALHQRQIEKYRLIKKLFLEKMFIK